MTYGTTQRRSESDKPAAESKRPEARRSEWPDKRFESLVVQIDGQGGSKTVSEANWRVKRPARWSERPIRG